MNPLTVVDFLILLVMLALGADSIRINRKSRHLFRDAQSKYAHATSLYYEAEVFHQEARKHLTRAKF